MPFIRITSQWEKERPLYIKTEHIESVAGPIEYKKPLKPGEIENRWDVEIRTVSQMTHTVHCPDVITAVALVRLALSVKEETITEKQLLFDRAWPSPLPK